MRVATSSTLSSDEGVGHETVHGARCQRRGANLRAPQSMAGRRSSSIGCRSLIGRRASIYISNYDPVKVNFWHSGEITPSGCCGVCRIESNYFWTWERQGRSHEFCTATWMPNFTCCFFLFFNSTRPEHAK